MISLSRPSIRRRDMDAVLSCMVTDRLGPGTLADELVTAVSGYLGIAGGIALRERTRAFALSLERLGIAPGTPIILDPLAPHSYHAVVHERGLVPVYVDVSADSLCIDAEGVERAISSLAEAGTPAAAIVTRTTYGFVPDMEALASFGIPIIEDISEGVGANTGEERVGRFGRFVIVAMEPDDIVTAGGGALLLAPGRNDRAALRRLDETLPSDALLPDMNAALGLTQIREIEKFIHRRAEIASVFSKALMRGRHRAPVQPGDAENVFHSFPVLIEGSVADVTSYARKKSVEIALAFTATVLERYGTRDPIAVSADGSEVGDGDANGSPDSPSGPAGETSLRPVPESEFPVARSLLLRCVHVPLYPSLTSKEVAAIERVLMTLP